jgi:two-component system, NarL family, sensor histidine kinase DegS
MAFAIDVFGPSFRKRLHNRRFWIVQALVIAISLAHTTFETLRVLHLTPDLYLLPISTYFIPVLYAALNFGIEGALPTALWCVVLTVPNILLFHHGAERTGVAAQLALLVMLGTVVARRVDRERRAKFVAEAANRRLADTQHSLQTYIGMALRAQEEERHRLSRELHDETVQDLLAVKAALEALRRKVDQQSSIEFIDTALQKSIEGMRRFCRALRPSVLDDLGLVAALEWLLSDLGGRTSIRASLEIVGESTRLDPELELVIFRIAQEALHNVERHADAGRVDVRMDYRVGGIRLQVEDDGHGFDPRRAREDGLGLVGMQERAKLVGATLRVSSWPGSTRVVVDSSAGGVCSLPAAPAVGISGQLRSVRT